MSYLVDAPRLSETVTAAAPSSRHQALVAAIRRHCPELHAIQVATTRGGARLSKRKVVTPSGELVHDDHEQWLAEQAASDGADYARTRDRLQPLDYRLTECAITTLYLIHDRGGRQQDFVQLEILQEDEFVERRLFRADGSSWGGRPTTLSHLIEQATDGEPLSDEAKVRFRPSAYRLRRAVDFARFLDEAVALDATQRAMQRQRNIQVTDVVTDGRVHPPRAVRVGDLDPEGQRVPWKGLRLVDDWTLSSAGRTGARLCAHWVFQLSDYTSPGGGREMSLTPVWTFAPKLTEVAQMPPSASALYAQLQTIDRRTGVPFGWYFWMLHGNRVHDWAGQHVLHAAEAGQITLPEHDHGVLRRWVERPYGF